MGHNTFPILGKPRAPELFKAGRESMWQGEAPITTDGKLLDDLLEAQERAQEAIENLTHARKASVEFADRDLSDAEEALRAALALVSTLRTAIAAVPATFGEVG